jgi:hypothetical protein
MSSTKTPCGATLWLEQLVLSTISGTCEVFRSREAMWDQSRYALDFFKNHDIPFWRMSNANDLVSGSDNWCLADNDTIVLYLKNGGVATLELPGPLTATYSVQWYDPLNGGEFKNGTATLLPSGPNISLGFPPTNEDGKDWVVLFRCNGCD